MKQRQGSNELDSSCSRARSSPVMLSAAKHLAAARDRPFAEFTLSGANVLGVTGCDESHGQGLVFPIEPCLKKATIACSNNHHRSQTLWPSGSTTAASGRSSAENPSDVPTCASSQQYAALRLPHRAIASGEKSVLCPHHAQQSQPYHES